MKCCGQEQYTTFCPDCGRKIGGDPLEEMLTHVKAILARIEKQCRINITWQRENPDRLEDVMHTEKKEANERKIEKFKRWIDSLELAMALIKKGKSE